MAGTPAAPSSTAELILEAREQIADGGEPLNSQTRSIIRQRTSFYVNLPVYTRQTLGIELGDEVEVHTFEDYAIIAPKEVNGNGE